MLMMGLGAGRKWALGGVLSVSAAFAMSAAVITVNSAGDSGFNQCATKLDPCSLRGAIAKANSAAGDDTIRFSLGAGDAGCDGNGNCTITLSTALPAVTGNLSIEGPGAAQLVIQRNPNAATPAFRIFTINPGLTVDIAGVNISNGRSGGGGGGILNEGSQLTLRDCAVSGNVSNYGGAIWNLSGPNGQDATLTMLNSTLIGNIAQEFIQFEQVEAGGIFNSSSLGSAFVNATNCVFSGNYGYNGGAISNSGSAPHAATITITDCSFLNNHGESGGAIQNRGSAGTPAAVVAGIKNSTFSGNSATDGGAIANYGSTVLLANCTLSGNSAMQGGGISNGTGSMLTLTNCTFSGNVANNNAGLSLRNVGAEVHVANTIFDRTVNFPNIFHDPSNGGSFTSLGHNLIDDAAGGGPLNDPGGLFNASGDQRNTDAQLNALANNGGPTQTHAISSSKSPAVNQGDDLRAPEFDQREFVRSGVTDVGAYEFGGVARASLANISTRLQVGSGDNALIAGFIVTGTQGKKVIVRGIGPSLPIEGVLANPTLELRNASGLVSANDDWVNSPNQQAIIDSTVPPSNDLESAIVATLPAENSSYTAILRGVNDGTGIGVVELFDLDRTVNSRLANISTRGLVGTGNNALIAGTILLGQPPQKVIVRAIGPSLPFPGTLANPTLELRDGNGGLVRANDDWKTGGQEAEINASTVPPSNDLESAVVADLPANGAGYTAIVRGFGDTTGIAVVEIFRLQ